MLQKTSTSISHMIPDTALKGESGSEDSILWQKELQPRGNIKLNTTSLAEMNGWTASLHYHKEVTHRLGQEGVTSASLTYYDQSQTMPIPPILYLYKLRKQQSSTLEKSWWTCRRLSSLNDWNSTFSQRHSRSDWKHPGNSTVQNHSREHDASKGADSTSRKLSVRNERENQGHPQ